MYMYLQLYSLPGNYLIRIEVFTASLIEGLRQRQQVSGVKSVVTSLANTLIDLCDVSIVPCVTLIVQLLLSAVQYEQYANSKQYKQGVQTFMKPSCVVFILIDNCDCLIRLTKLDEILLLDIRVKSTNIPVGCHLWPEVI